MGDTTKATGVSAKMIRHYKSIGLIPTANQPSTTAGIMVTTTFTAWGSSAARETSASPLPRKSASY